MHGVHTPNAGETALTVWSGSVALQYPLSQTYAKVLYVFQLLRAMHCW